MTDFLSALASFFSYPFVQKALLVGSLISLSAALLGTTLVLKRYSMIGDGLSHVGFGALAIATSFHIADVAVGFALPVVVIAAFFLLRLSENSKIHGDAAIALISTTSLAIGYMVMHKNGTNVDVGNYMFGNVFTITDSDVVFSVVLAIAVMLLFLLFYHKIFSVTFDESFSKAIGVSPALYNGMIAVLTAVVVVLGMRMMGTLLISALIIFPSLTSMRFCKSFFSVVTVSAGISLLAFLLGILLAHFLDFPAGSTIVVINALFYLAGMIFSKIRSRL